GQGETEDFGRSDGQIVDIDRARSAGEDRAVEEGEKALPGQRHTATDRVLLEVAQRDQTEPKIGRDDPAQENGRGEQEGAEKIEVAEIVLAKLKIPETQAGHTDESGQPAG